MTYAPGQPIRFVLHLETDRECSGVVSQVLPSGQLVARPRLDRGGEWYVWPSDVTWAGEVPAEKGRKRQC